MIKKRELKRIAKHMACTAIMGALGAGCVTNAQIFANEELTEEDISCIEQEIEKIIEKLGRGLISSNGENNA